jgi:hypothetical protein
MYIFDLNNAKDRAVYSGCYFPRQYGYMSSANRAIKNFKKKYGNRKFSINQLDENCFEVNLHRKN